MNPSQILRIAVVILLVVGGGWMVRSGIIDQSTLDQLLGQGEQGVQVSEARQDEPVVTEPAREQPAAQPAPQPTVAALPPIPQGSSRVCGYDLEVEREDWERLSALARREGVEFPNTFARVVDHLYDEDRLPSCYFTKNQARDQGWQRGVTVRDVAPGRAIGGDFFGNREGRLPSRYNGDYREADIDYDGGGRGANRLVYVQGRADEGLVWLTTDHYESFIPLFGQ